MKEYFPKNEQELVEIIEKLFKNKIYNLNCINTSNITYMTNLFNVNDGDYNIPDIDVSKWDVSNVKDMECMFCGCSNLKCDLSNWNVSKCENFENMFEGCNIDNLNIDNWNVNPTSNTRGMFFNIKTPNHLPNWYLNRQMTVRYIH